MLESLSSALAEISLLQLRTDRNYRVVMPGPVPGIHVLILG